MLTDENVYQITKEHSYEKHWKLYRQIGKNL